jgi:hypothetical protein
MALQINLSTTNVGVPAPAAYAKIVAGAAVIATSSMTVSTYLTGITDPIGLLVDNGYLYVTSQATSNKLIHRYVVSTNSLDKTYGTTSYVQRGKPVVGGGALFCPDYASNKLYRFAL